MATHHGNSGTVYEGTDAVGEVKSFSYDETCDTAEDTSMGDTDKSYVAGHKDGSGSVVCHYDHDDTAQGAFNTGDTVTLKLHAEGEGVGNDEWTGDVIVTSLSFSASLDAIIEATFGFQGALTQGTIPA
jgi:hypothetical protein